MKRILLSIVILFVLASCGSTRKGYYPGTYNPPGDTLITQSLFNDRASTISEENIQKILDGNFKLPSQLRVVVVRLEGNPQVNRYYGRYMSDEGYLKTQQSYLDLFSEQLRKSARVTRLSIIPELLVSRSPNFTSIREAAVRMQADAIVVYSINSDVYSKYKLFSKADIKAFATTQLMIMDVRTGLIPFSTIMTKDYLSQKKKEELDYSEAASRIQNEAVLLTIQEIGQSLQEFLNRK